MLKNRIVFRIALALVTLALWTPFSQAQNFRGRIQGSITDQSGGTIANATVVLTNVATNVRTVRQTSSTGLYVFDNMDPGTYAVSVEMTGFSKFIQENILLQANGDVTVNAALRPGSLQTTVTVTAEPPAVDFASANKDTTLDTKTAEETPRLDRNPFKMGLLEPSAINTRGEVLPL